MFHLKALIFALLLLVASVPITYAQPLGGMFQSSAGLLEVAAYSSVDQVPAGAPFEVVVVVDIEDGWKPRCVVAAERRYPVSRAKRPAMSRKTGTALGERLQFM